MTAPPARHLVFKYSIELAIIFPKLEFDGFQENVLLNFELLASKIGGSPILFSDHCIFEFIPNWFTVVSTTSRTDVGMDEPIL